MNCCNKNNQKTQDKENKKERGIWAGLIYGLVPHIGCIAFIVFSILGVTFVTSIFKPLLLNPYFFHILVGLSFVFATISAAVYLKKNKILSSAGIKRKWKYLSTLYGTTVGINLFLFMVIFPVVANLNSGVPLTAAISTAFGRGEGLILSESESLLTLQVNIPCPGHAPLIIGELKTISGVEAVRFKFPNSFDVGYNPEKTSKEQILSLDVFNTYKTTITNEQQEQQIRSKPGLKDEGFINIPLSEVSENTKWYEYDLGDKAVKFFVVQARDGSIKTAFDACDVCYYSGKGYRQEGDYMVCNNCGNRYPISGLGVENKIPGGCWPGYLSNIVEEDYILIKEKDLTDNSWRTL